MQDIFISYSKKDEQIAQTIAEALQKEGLDVWWDVEIPAGSTFDAVIEKAIGDAKCVIVLWSQHSIKSEWVHLEAAEGKRRNVLIPIRIADVEIPFAFRRRQTADLSNWLNGISDSSFDRLVSDIRLTISSKEQNSNEEEELVHSKRIKSKQESPSKALTKEFVGKSNFPKYLRIGGVLILIAVLSFALKYMLSGNSDNLKIGDSYDGGIIFQVGPNGNEIKICAEHDLGFYNWHEAKEKCDEYSDGGHMDWYLPSKEELNLLFNNLSQKGLGNFKENWYWSSTETDGQGWEQQFPEGYQQNNGGGNKSNSFVRAIRLVQLSTKKIGDHYAGGIIFQIDSLGQHGKVCSKSDLGSLNWYDAKTQCEDYSEGEYTDWYLPSRDELNLLYNNLSLKGLGNFKDDWYWSSTDTDGEAWEQHFGGGFEQNDGGGNNSISSVRAIRSF